MNNSLKHSLTLFWIAVLLISGYKLFSAKDDKEASEPPPALIEVVAQPIIAAPAPEPQIIIQERVVTQTVVVTEIVESEPATITPAVNPELKKLQQELSALNVAFAVNAKNLYPAVIDLKKLSTRGQEATREVTQMKHTLSKLRKERGEIDAELKAYKQRKELTSGFRKYGPQGLSQRQNALKEEMAESKRALAEKEAQVAALKLAYDKANNEKLRLQRERIEHMAWQKELKLQIEKLKPETPKP